MDFFSSDRSGRTRDSCGKSGLGETPQERMRRGGSPTARGKRVFWNEDLLGFLVAVYLIQDSSLKKYIKLQSN
ncbi:hypothetical protein [Bacillus mesophilus]|uniref:hypothetical protein n=1 Tax=Bacillus mesophilus TaxID=1808955 RepID=UPI003084044E